MTEQQTCPVQVASPNDHLAHLHGDWLPCSRSRHRYGNHKHDPSGYEWESFPVGDEPATGEWPIYEANR